MLANLVNLVLRIEIYRGDYKDFYQFFTQFGLSKSITNTDKNG